MLPSSLSGLAHVQEQATVSRAESQSPYSAGVESYSPSQPRETWFASFDTRSIFTRYLHARRSLSVKYAFVCEGVRMTLAPKCSKVR